MEVLVFNTRAYFTAIKTILLLGGEGVFESAGAKGWQKKRARIASPLLANWILVVNRNRTRDINTNGKKQHLSDSSFRHVTTFDGDFDGAFGDSHEYLKS